jgi:UDP-glucose 4-epimerase
METDGAVGEVFNVGGTREITIRELAGKIIRMTDSRSTLQATPYDQAFAKDFEDMQRRVPGIGKIKRLIGFEPKTDLDKILSLVIEYARQNPPEEGCNASK